jgi:hypothetical protein
MIVMVDGFSLAQTRAFVEQVVAVSAPQVMAVVND